MKKVILLTALCLWIPSVIYAQDKPAPCPTQGQAPDTPTDPNEKCKPDLNKIEAPIFVFPEDEEQKDEKKKPE